MKKMALTLVGALCVLFAACSNKIDKLKFSDCEEIKKFVEKSRATQPQLAMRSGPGSGDDKAAEIPTVQQEAEVSEPDIFQATADQFFVARSSGTEVVERKTLSYTGRLPSDQEGQLLVSAQGKLIRVTPQPGSILVELLKTSPGSLPKVLSTRSYQGALVESRLSHEKLLLVASDFNLEAKFDGRGKSLSDIPCSCILKPNALLPNYSLTKVIELDIADESLPESSLGYLGDSEIIYVTPKHVYTASTEWAGVETIFSQIAYSSDKAQVEFKARGKVPGTIKDRWAMKELEDQSLAVAVSNTEGWNTKNQLLVLSPQGTKLEVRAKTEPFGLREDIRSVRYVGKTAYVVTFRKTDPLFAIDLSVIKSPKILGELKIPGFSTHLQPWPTNRLIGIGYDATEQGDVGLFQGIQVNLFDVKDPTHLDRLDFKTFGERGSYSDATWDSHSLYISSDQRRIGIPLVELKTSGPSFVTSEILSSGAVILEVEDNGKLKEKFRLSHASSIPANCLDRHKRFRWWSGRQRSLDINRLIENEGKLIAISRYKIGAYTLEGSALPESTVFPAASAGRECEDLDPNSLICD